MRSFYRTDVTTRSEFAGIAPPPTLVEVSAVIHFRWTGGEFETDSFVKINFFRVRFKINT